MTVLTHRRCFATAWMLIPALLIGVSDATAQTARPEDVPSESAGPFVPPDGLPDLSGLVGGGFGSEAMVSAQFMTTEDGRAGRLSITAELTPGWHIYSVTQPEDGPQRTEIQTRWPEGVESVGFFKPDRPPEVKHDDIFPVPSEEHYGQVTWSVAFRVADGVDASTLVIPGHVEGQVCSAEGSCVPLNADKTSFEARWSGTLSAQAAAALQQVIADAPEGIASDDVAASAVKKPFTWQALLLNVGAGLLGGLILNLMPCVLPVIGLKVLGFVEQGGQSRSRTLMLNIIYSAGLISVFLVLATISVVATLQGETFGWGEQFTKTAFKIPVTALVFVMALSFLGIWEIPIPGFVGAGKSGELAAREDATGAFFKGIITTILATPCAAPLLGPLFTYTLGQPSAVTYAVFLSIGLGMASPYLLIGAFPALIRFLPKPGAWMDTFKQLMAFLLLGTVVYLFSTINEKYFIATLSTLVGLWFACWWIGRTSIVASAGQKASARIGGTLVAGAVGVGSFIFLVPGETDIAWVPYSPEVLHVELDEGETVLTAIARKRTVLVDFTADWCPNCKLNMAFAIDTPEVAELIERNGVLPLVADWTDESEGIKDAINAFGAQSIPLLAIYPAGRPEEVTLLYDLITQQQLLDALEDAGPSLSLEPAGDDD